MRFVKSIMFLILGIVGPLVVFAAGVLLNTPGFVERSVWTLAVGLLLVSIPASWAAVNVGTLHTHKTQLEKLKPILAPYVSDPITNYALGVELLYERLLNAHREAVELRNEVRLWEAENRVRRANNKAVYAMWNRVVTGEEVVSIRCAARRGASGAAIRAAVNKGVPFINNLAIRQSEAKHKA